MKKSNKKINKLIIGAIIIILVGVGFRYYKSWEKKQEEARIEKVNEENQFLAQAMEELGIRSSISVAEGQPMCITFQKVNLAEVNARIKWAREQKGLADEQIFEFQDYLDVFDSEEWENAQERQEYIEYYQQYFDEIKTLEELFPNQKELLEPLYPSQDGGIVFSNY